MPLLQVNLSCPVSLIPVNIVVFELAHASAARPVHLAGHVSAFVVAALTLKLCAGCVGPWVSWV